MANFTFFPIRTMTIIDGYEVLVHFRNGKAKTYDFAELFKNFEPLNPLLHDYDRFKNFRISVGGYGIIWDDELDLAAEEVWYDGTPIESPFVGLMSFNEATEEWNLNSSTLRKAIQYGKLRRGIDAMNFGKQWVVSREAMTRVYGPSPRENPTLPDEDNPPIIKYKKPVITKFYDLTIELPAEVSDIPHVIVKSERGEEVLLNVETLGLYGGMLNQAQAELLLDWASKHQNALLKMTKTGKFKNLPILV